LIHVKRAVNKILPLAKETFDEGNFFDAFYLLRKAEKYIPKNKEFLKLDSAYSSYQSIYTDPPGAEVYFKAYNDTTENWRYLGITPVDSVKLPILTVLKYKVVKQGYDTVFAVQPTVWNFYRKLFTAGTTPDGMVSASACLINYHWQVPAGVIPSILDISGLLANDSTGDYFIDKFEVTNAQFKRFITAGGYQNRKFWKYPFVKEKKQISWEETMTLFIDQTGRPGPSTWKAGDYQRNEEDYPVSGISWYEAAAYAEFAGKELPTFTHWIKAKGLETFESYLLSKSNFKYEGPARVGLYKGMNAFGTYDMAGNVREWCFNGNSSSRTTCGGAWNDPFYAYRDVNIVNPFDRSEKNGFRCVKYTEKEKIPSICFDTLNLGNPPPEINYKLYLVNDDVFKTVKDQFFYAKTSLDSRIEWKDDSNKNYTLEKVTFSTAYDDKRIIAYLCLPKTAVPPYQTVIMFPGMDWFNPGGSSETMIKDQIAGVNYYLKDGRAIIFPVFYGSLERANDITNVSVISSNGLVNQINDFSRLVDYLETREDFDADKFAVWGASWGGILCSQVAAIDKRVKTLILYISSNAFIDKEFPEWSGINFVPRIKIPTLMLEGKYDIYFDFKTCTKPMFDFLGTPAKDKKLVLYETDHFIPYKDAVKESLGWLDKYFGPTKKSRDKSLKNN
jgi:dienelactone hydrolase